MATGTAVINFGTTPVEEASIAVTGQTTIAADSHIEAFFMKETTGDNGLDEHEEAAALCPLVCGNIIVGTGFTIYAMPIAAYGIGQFNVRWVWV